MILGQHIFDELTARAKVSPHLRMNLVLRNSSEDLSRRMLSAIEPGMVSPIHRHRNSSETVVCLRGHFREYLYDDFGTLTAAMDMFPGGNVLAVHSGQWHSQKSLPTSWPRNPTRTNLDQLEPTWPSCLQFEIIKSSRL